MKKILTIIMTIVAMMACNPVDDTITFNPEDLTGTRWEGPLKEVEGKVVKTTSQVTIRFNTISEGQMTNRRNGATGKESYEMSWSSSGQKIVIDCPVINGTWEVSAYTDKTMTLTILPDRNKIINLIRI